MKPGKRSHFKMEANLNVVRPTKESAYPIPLAEWQFLRKKVEQIMQPSRWYNSIGSFFVGVSGSSFAAAIALPSSAEPRVSTICWVTFLIAGLVGGLFLFFDTKTMKSLESSSKTAVLDEMTRLENRFAQNRV